MRLVPGRNSFKFKTLRGKRVQYKNESSKSDQDNPWYRYTYRYVPSAENKDLKYKDRLYFVLRRLGPMV